MTGSTSKIGLRTISVNQDAIFYCIQRYSSNNKKLEKFKNVIIIHYDGNYQSILDKIKNININSVIHLASYYNNFDNIKDISKYLDVLKLGNYLLEIMILKKIRNLIYTSSYFQYENNGFKYLYATYKNIFLLLTQKYSKENKITFTNFVIYDVYQKVGNKRQRLLKILKKLDTVNLPKKTDRYFLVHNHDIVNAISNQLISKNKNKTYSLIYKNQKNTFGELIYLIEKKLKRKLTIKWNSFNVSVKNQYYFPPHLNGRLNIT